MVGDSIWEIDIRHWKPRCRTLLRDKRAYGAGQIFARKLRDRPPRFDPAEMRREIRTAKRQLQIGVRELSSPALP